MISEPCLPITDHQKINKMGFRLVTFQLSTFLMKNVCTEGALFLEEFSQDACLHHFGIVSKI